MLFLLLLLMFLLLTAVTAVVFMTATVRRVLPLPDLLGLELGLVVQVLLLVVLGVVPPAPPLCGGLGPAVTGAVGGVST